MTDSHLVVAEGHADLRQFPLSAHGDALAWLVQRLAPGGRVVRTRRLRGGLSRRMDVIGVRLPDGDRRRFTLRRFVQVHRYPEDTAASARREHDVLRLAGSAEIPAPRPLWLDADGAHFGVPALVLTYVAGRPMFPREPEERWVAGLADAIARVHAVTAATHDLSSLEISLGERVVKTLDGWRIEGEQSALIAAALDVLRARAADVRFASTPVLTHGDYWSGNTVWHRGRLAGIVDWSSTKAGDPRYDVTSCRVDLTVSHGIEAADAFLREYERVAGAPIEDVWFFDLLNALPGLAEYDHWLDGYRDLGVTWLSPDETLRRLRAFVGRAMEQGAARAAVRATTSS